MYTKTLLPAVTALLLSACAAEHSAAPTTVTMAPVPSSSTQPRAAAPAAAKPDLTTPEKANASLYAMFKSGDRDGVWNSLGKRVAANFKDRASFDAWFTATVAEQQRHPSTNPFRLVEENGEYKLDEM